MSDQDLVAALLGFAMLQWRDPALLDAVAVQVRGRKLSPERLGVLSLALGNLKLDDRALFEEVARQLMEHVPHMGGTGGWDPGCLTLFLASMGDLGMRTPGLMKVYDVMCDALVAHMQALHSVALARSTWALT